MSCFTIATARLDIDGAMVQLKTEATRYTNRNKITLYYPTPQDLATRTWSRKTDVTRIRGWKEHVVDGVLCLRLLLDSWSLGIHRSRYANTRSLILQTMLSIDTRCKLL